jgi:hypothetical protein
MQYLAIINTQITQQHPHMQDLAIINTHALTTAGRYAIPSNN